MKYITKPEIIEAVKFDGTNAVEIKNFVGENNCIINSYDAAWEVGVNLIFTTIEIKTEYGNKKLNESDWVIRDSDNKLSVCYPWVFEKTYMEFKEN